MPFEKPSNVITSFEEYFIYSILDNVESRHVKAQLKRVRRRYPTILWGETIPTCAICTAEQDNSDGSILVKPLNEDSYFYGGRL